MQNIEERKRLWVDTRSVHSGQCFFDNGHSKKVWRKTLKDIKVKGGFAVSDEYVQISESWDVIVKDDILFKYTRPINIESGILAIKADNSMAGSAIVLKKDAILKTIKIIVSTCTVTDLKIKH